MGIKPKHQFALVFEALIPPSDPDTMYRGSNRHNDTQMLKSSVTMKNTIIYSYKNIISFNITYTFEAEHFSDFVFPSNYSDTEIFGSVRFSPFKIDTKVSQHFSTFQYCDM